MRFEIDLSNVMMLLAVIGLGLHYATKVILAFRKSKDQQRRATTRQRASKR